MEDGEHMATLDWSKCPAVESVPGRLSGAWVFRDTRMPVSAVFENLEAGATIEEIIEQFDITREQINAVLESLSNYPNPCLTLFGSETAPSRGKNRQSPKILVTMKSDNLAIFGVYI